MRSNDAVIAALLLARVRGRHRQVRSNDTVIAALLWVLGRVAGLAK